MGFATRNLPGRHSFVWSSKLWDSRENEAGGDANNDQWMDDKELLQEVPKSKLVELCTLYQLSSKGSAHQLLQRLRDFAADMAEQERVRLQGRVVRVEQGFNEDSKERYEILSEEYEVEEDSGDDEEEGFFYFAIPSNDNNRTTSKPPKPSFVTNSVITAPPPPDVEPDENGERVVTVYSSSDINDLTGITNSNPGLSGRSNQEIMASLASDGGSTSWDLQNSQRKSEKSSKELEDARELVTELVQTLLSLSGAPGFRDEFTDGLQPLSEVRRSRSSSFSPSDFVGFDPKLVSTDTLAASSQALRIGRGQVLQDVLREFELRAIGYDGMAGDDMERGGGHYREVSKVRAFLEGYRRAEVRRVARDTLTLLLDKIMTEGVGGLDLTLASMTRGSDDDGDVGELNDSLLNFLDDEIRRQQRKVEMLAKTTTPNDANYHTFLDDASPAINGLWNVTTENGVQVETFDPNNPESQRILNEERIKLEKLEATETRLTVPHSVPEKLLLLLQSLRDRLKAEAFFTQDEKGRNLRILAYCLKCQTSSEQKALITTELGSSVDRLDSFSELVASSIEYAESTSYELQPAKRQPLNVRVLRSILDLVMEIRENLTLKASGIMKNK